MFTRIIIMQSFIDYVLEYYGRDGIWDMGATRTMVCDTINKYLDCANQQWSLPKSYGMAYLIPFGYDSTDREIIRDMMIRDYGLVFPN